MGAAAQPGVVLWVVRAVIVVGHEKVMYLFVLAGEVGILLLFAIMGRDGPGAPH